MFDPDRVVCGGESTRYGTMLFAVVGPLEVEPFPAIALAGAAVGVRVSVVVGMTWPASCMTTAGSLPCTNNSVMRVWREE